MEKHVWNKNGLEKGILSLNRILIHFKIHFWPHWLQTLHISISECSLHVNAPVSWFLISEWTVQLRCDDEAGCSRPLVSFSIQRFWVSASETQCWCETIISRRQTAPAPWIRHLSAKLINPERGRMASASVLRDRHGEEGIWGLKQRLHLSAFSETFATLFCMCAHYEFVDKHSGICMFFFLCFPPLIYPAVSLSPSHTRRQLQVQPT